MGGRKDRLRDERKTKQRGLRWPHSTCGDSFDRDPRIYSVSLVRAGRAEGGGGSVLS